MKKLFYLIKRHYLLLIFILLIFFVAAISLYKIYVVKPTYVYVKVRLGQGLWWATTANSPVWFINSFKIGERQYDLSGKPIAEITAVNYFPVFITTYSTRFTDEYNVYLTIKLKVSNGKRLFNRSIVAVGAPIDFEFDNNQFSGTIIGLNNNPFNNPVEKKIVILTKESTDQQEYQAIKIGDYYFDGINKNIQIIDKQYDGNNIIIKAQILLKKQKGQFILGEEEIVAINKKIDFITNSSVYYDYFVLEIH